MSYDLTAPELLDSAPAEDGVAVDAGDGSPVVEPVEPAAFARGGAVVVWAALGAVWATLARWQRSGSVRH